MLYIDPVCAQHIKNLNDVMMAPYISLPMFTVMSRCDDTWLIGMSLAASRGISM
jgi:hypothetical protein